MDKITEDSPSESKNSSNMPRKFDFMEVFSEAYSVAKERNQARNLESMQDPPEEVTENRANSDNVDDKELSDNDDQEEQNPTVSNKDKEDKYFLPVSQNLTLCHGIKPLTALGVDPAGARIATGGFDFDVKLWDFGGMDISCRPFKVIRPCEEHQIKNLEFSPSGEHLLVISGSAHAFILDRDGETVCFTNKGFQYITDPACAKGHTHALNWGIWHPLDPVKILTCSQDSTLRIWDITDMESIMNDVRIPTQKTVIKPRNAQGRKSVPTVCAYSKDAQIIAAGCLDGSLQFWDTRRPFVNTTQVMRTAHPLNTEITNISFSWDGRQMLSRAMDDTLKLWDARALSKGPVFTLQDLPVIFNQTDATFSPNDHIFTVAVSATRGNPNSGYLAFYRRDNCQLIKKLNPEHGSVTRVLWHHRLNQIFCASSDGTGNVYYDNDASHHGALMCATRQASAASRRRRMGTGEAYMKPVLLTYDDEAVRAARKSKKYLNNTEVESELAIAAVNAIYQKDHYAAQAAREDSAKMRAPVREESFGNRVGSLHQFMVQQIVLRKNEADERAEKDIRGAILRHAEEAKKQPFWTKAYQKTQPNPIFHNPDEDVKKDDTPHWKKQKLA